MNLSDGDIRERLASRDLIIEPIEQGDVQIQPASVDLRLSPIIHVMRNDVECIDVANIETYTNKVEITDKGYVLHPHEFILGSTIEMLRIPDDLVGEVHGKSTLGRIGLAVHITAGFIDPGFEGTITLEIVNFGMIPVKIRPNMRICQLKITQLLSRCEVPYGFARGSKYKGQSTVTPAVTNKDLPL